MQYTVVVVIMPVEYVFRESPIVSQKGVERRGRESNVTKSSVSAVFFLILFAVILSEFQNQVDPPVSTCIAHDWRMEAVVDTGLNRKGQSLKWNR